MFLLRLPISPISRSANTVPGRSSVVARISAKGPTAVECPHAWYVAPSTLAGEHVSTNTWLSTARALCRSSQCTGPVTVLNAPGNTNVSAPRSRTPPRARGSGGRNTPHAQPPRGRVHHRQRLARGQDVRLPERDLARDVDVEQVRLAVLREQRARLGEDAAGVIQRPVRAHRSGMDPATTTHECARGASANRRVEGWSAAFSGGGLARRCCLS